jgi:hypothetical protein
VFDADEANQQCFCVPLGFMRSPQFALLRRGEFRLNRVELYGEPGVYAAFYSWAVFSIAVSDGLGWRDSADDERRWDRTDKGAKAGTEL